VNAVLVCLNHGVRSQCMSHMQFVHGSYVRGALPPVDLRAVCLVRAIAVVVVDNVGDVVDGWCG
jgi:hypothetical protein